MIRHRVRLSIGFTLVLLGIVTVNLCVNTDRFVIALLGVLACVIGSLYLIVVLARNQP